MRFTVVLVPVLAMMATACGDPEGGTAVPKSRPTGADEVVVQVMVSGGFVPVSAAVSAVPTVTVLGDGTVITMAPMVMIYPGPAITPLQSVQVPGATVDQLVARAADLGLLDGPLDFGQPLVADAPDTTVTITAAGTTHRHVANALALDDRAGHAGAGISAQAAANRRALATFVEATSALPPGQAPWRPPAIAVYVLGDHRPDPQLPQPAMPWPLAAEPELPAADGAMPCTLVEGADVEALLAALDRANALTPWIIGGEAWSIAFRPVVPGQPGCPPA